MLYSIIPEYIVFADTKTTYGSLQEIYYKNQHLMVRKFPSGEMRVERLLSTNPKDYLYGLNPGDILKNGGNL